MCLQRPHKCYISTYMYKLELPKPIHQQKKTIYTKYITKEIGCLVLLQNRIAGKGPTNAS